MEDFTEETENKISPENAKEQIQSLLDYYGLDKADIELENGAEAIQTMLNTLTRAIVRGNLSVDLESGKLQITQKLSRKIETKDGDTTHISYFDKIGNANLAMDSIAGKKAEARTNAFMAALSSVPHTVLIKLEGFDRTVLSRLSQLFSLV